VDRPRPDWALFHVLQAFAYLVLTAGLGLALAILEPSDASLRVAMAYGVCGLLGFLCQLVVGIEARLLPLAAWLQAFAAGGYRDLPASQHTAMPRAPAAAALALWTLGTPALALGLALDRPAWTTVGASGLALAVALVTVSVARALATIGRPAGASSSSM
jgi:hypothetical protein